MTYDVATIQTKASGILRRAFYAPRTNDGESVMLDACPRQTLDVHTFHRAADAAAFIGCSTSTVYRQLRDSNMDELDYLFDR